nr:hypothetical protein CFP56_19406 [Quercus suber]
MIRALRLDPRSEIQRAAASLSSHDAGGSSDAHETLALPHLASTSPNSRPTSDARLFYIFTDKALRLCVIEPPVPRIRRWRSSKTRSGWRRRNSSLRINQLRRKLSTRIFCPNLQAPTTRPYESLRML